MLYKIKFKKYIKVKRAKKYIYTSKTKSDSKCHLGNINVLMSKYYFLARLYFNIEEFFRNTDIKDREMYRRTTSMLNGFLFLHDIKNIVFILNIGKSRKLEFF